MLAEIPKRAKGIIQAKVAASTKNDKDSQYNPAEKKPTPNHQPIENADQEANLLIVKHRGSFEVRQPSINHASPTNPGINKGHT